MRDTTFSAARQATAEPAPSLVVTMEVIVARDTFSEEADVDAKIFFNDYLDVYLGEKRPGTFWSRSPQLERAGESYVSIFVDTTFSMDSISAANASQGALLSPAGRERIVAPTHPDARTVQVTASGVPGSSDSWCEVQVEFWDDVALTREHGEFEDRVEEYVLLVLTQTAQKIEEVRSWHFEPLPAPAEPVEAYPSED